MKEAGALLVGGLVLMIMNPSMAWRLPELSTPEVDSNNGLRAEYLLTKPLGSGIIACY